MLIYPLSVQQILAPLMSSCGYTHRVVQEAGSVARRPRRAARSFWRSGQAKDHTDMRLTCGFHVVGYVWWHLRAAHKASLRTGAAGAGARSGPGRPPARPARAPREASAGAYTAALPRQGSFDGNRRPVVLPRPLASNQKGAELRRWRVAREKNERKKITAAASDLATSQQNGAFS